VQHDAEACIPSPNPRYGRVAAALVETWAEFQKSVVDDAINQWRKKTRLEACIRADGGTLISCCDVACLTCKLPRKTDGSYHSGTHHNSTF